LIYPISNGEIGGRERLGAQKDIFTLQNQTDLIDK
jgi:hypothetical protein